MPVSQKVKMTKKDIEKHYADQRQTAYLWHNGQGSPLYAFASSGIVEDRAALIAEIREWIAYVECTSDDYVPDDLASLLDLIDFVEDLPCCAP